MTPVQLPRREEMRGLSHQGEDAVLVAYDMLVSTIRALEARVQVLEDQLKKDSHNSGKPPSSDGLKKPIKSRKRHTSGKKAGGQVGHVGHRLELLKNRIMWKYIQSNTVSIVIYPWMRLPQIGLGDGKYSIFPKKSNWK